LIIKLNKQKNVATFKFHHVYFGLKIMNRLYSVDIPFRTIGKAL
jgi:hypothetical protein